MKNIYKIGTIAAVAAFAVAPAAAFAEPLMGVGAQGQLNVTEGSLGVHASSTVSGREGSGTTSARAEVYNGVHLETHTSSSDEGVTEASSSDREAGKNEHGKSEVHSSLGAEISALVRGDMASSTVRATTLAQLRQIIATREAVLSQQEASSSVQASAVLKNANPVRLAVHTFLASKDLLGGIGPQVSAIAQQVNASLATTSEAQAQIESRGFFTRLFFGGDQNAAAKISAAVQKNQQHINALTQLLNQANISVSLKTTLQAQITALQDAQTKLQALAQQQQSTWGLFSWRF